MVDAHDQDQECMTVRIQINIDSYFPNCQSIKLKSANFNSYTQQHAKVHTIIHCVPVCVINAAGSIIMAQQHSLLIISYHPLPYGISGYVTRSLI